MKVILFLYSNKIEIQSKNESNFNHLNKIDIKQQNRNIFYGMLEALGWSQKPFELREHLGRGLRKIYVWHVSIGQCWLKQFPVASTSNRMLAIISPIHCVLTAPLPPVKEKRKFANGQKRSKSFFSASKCHLWGCTSFWKHIGLGCIVMSLLSSVSKPICFTLAIKEVQTENKNIHVHCKWKKAIILTLIKKNYFSFGILWGIGAVREQLLLLCAHACILTPLMSTGSKYPGKSPPNRTLGRHECA